MNRYRPIAHLWLLLGVMFTASTQAAPIVASHPRNPWLLSDSAVVSSGGLSRVPFDIQQPGWQTLHGKQTFEPLVAGARLFVGSRRGLYAVNVETGAVLWSFQPGGPVFSPLALGLCAGVQLAGRVAKGEPMGCIACHTAAPGGDMVYNSDRHMN